MRVDRSGLKGIGGAVSGSGKETSIQRKNGKVKLTAGKEDEVLITQVQDSIRIQVNNSSVLALSREESKNLEILPGAGRVSIDSNVTIPIKGRAPAKTEDTATSRVDPSVSSGRKEETSFTSSITQKLITSGLPDTSVLETKPIVMGNEGLQPSVVRTTRPQSEDDRRLSVLAGESPAPLSERDQTVSFIRSFIGNRSLSLSDQQTIHTLLASAGTPGEFNEIVNEAGGKKVVELFKNAEMKLSWDRLVGAYVRLDLAENRQEAKKTRELLLGDANSLQQYLFFSDQPLVLRGNVLTNEIDLSLLDRRATVCLVLENAVRAREGHALINPNQLREKTIDILIDSTIPKEKQLDLLEDIRTTAGLSEYQMREIVSRPLTGFFESAASDLVALRDSKTEIFQKQIQQAVDDFGPESVAVEIGRAERDEFLQNIEPEITQFQVLKATASEIFSGPADPLVKVDTLLQQFQKDFLPPHQIPTLLEGIDKGSVVFQDDKLPSALLKVKIPELKNFAQQGIQFLLDLPNTRAMVEQMRNADIGGFESFEFLQRLVDGAFRKQLNAFSQSFQHSEAASPFREIEEHCNRWRTNYEKTTTRKDREFILDTGLELMQNFADGLLTKPVNEFARNIEDLQLDVHCSEVIESVRTGSDLLLAFRNGHFVQILAAVSQRAANNPALLQIIKQALHLTTTGTNFFRGLLNRDWEKPIAQALKKDPRSKELREVYGVLSDALNLFLPLQSIDYLTPFLQYQKQLGAIRDETVRNKLIQRYETQALSLRAL
ncbi:hypothetical protein L0222_18050 [bacterium]|nr:hypothetical protein [bacterium]